MNRPYRVLLLVILLSFGLLFTAAFLAALPSIVRAMPGRYAYYLPEPLQAWRQVEHPDTLPTPVAAATLPPSPTPTHTPLPSPTQKPVASTPSPSPSPSSSPTPSSTLPTDITLAGIRHEHQGWNNCGPTTLAMALSYWERAETQHDIAPCLKPDPEDKNVSPYEMADHTRTLGLEAALRVGGDVERLKHLLAAGFPVIVETWYVHTPDDQMGHYRLVIGYDDATQEFLTYDSLHGPDILLTYQEMDELWRAFNRVYLVIYPPERADDLNAALGPDVDRQAALQDALETARAEAAAPPTTCVAYADCSDAEVFAWFNLGTNLVTLGRYDEAAAAYDQARILGLPYRILWYEFGPYEAYYATGRYEDVITLADATLRVANNLEESYYWRGKARQALGDLEGARADFEAALRYHEGWPPAVEAIKDLEE